MIEQILLDEHARGKLHVYGKLLTLPPGEYMLDHLRENLEVAISQVRLKKLLVSIQEDLENIYETKIFSSKKKLFIAEEMIQYNQYQHFLSTKSIPYQLLLSIITNKDADLMAFCQRNYISRSTCFRQTKKLAHYLKEHEITLNLSNLTITGSEMLIRIIFFNFFWFVSLGESLDELSFSHELEKLIYRHEGTNLKNKFEIGKREAMLHCKISLLRIKNGHFTDIYQLTTTSFIPNGTKLDFFYDYFQIADLKLDILEVNYLFYLFYYWPFLTSNQDIRFPVIAHSYQKINDSLKKILQEFNTHCNQYISDFQLQENPSLYLNIYLSFLNFSLFKQKIPLTTFFISSYITEKYPMLHILTSKLESFWRKVAHRKNFSWLKTCSKDLAFIQACLLYPHYVKLEEKYKLKVGFIDVSEHLISSEIINLVEKILFVDIERITLPITKEFDFFIFGSPLLVPDGLDPSTYLVVDFCRYKDFGTTLYQKILKVHNTKLQEQA